MSEASKNKKSYPGQPPGSLGLHTVGRDPPVRQWAKEESRLLSLPSSDRDLEKICIEIEKTSSQLQDAEHHQTKCESSTNGFREDNLS